MRRCAALLEVSMLDAAMEQATLTRKKENEQFKQSVLDDQAAVDLIESTMQVIFWGLLGVFFDLIRVCLRRLVGAVV